ncbi:MAG: hypothetical protein R6U00_03515 [Prochlorococcaceae cyanobacterium]
MVSREDDLVVVSGQRQGNAVPAQPLLRDGVSPDVAALNDLFRCQAALNTARRRWQAQWSRPIPSQPLTVQEVGLAVSLESGCCSAALEAYWLVLVMVRPECLRIR